MQTARIGEPGFAAARLPAEEVLLADHCHGVGRFAQAVGVYVPHHDPAVERVGDKQALMPLVKHGRAA